jgi:hypothetical protein
LRDEVSRCELVGPARKIREKCAGEFTIASLIERLEVRQDILDLIS